MIPYYALICLPLIFAIFYELFYEKYDLRQKKNYTIVIFFTIYYILLAFRGKYIGVDTARYLSIHETISNYTWKEVFSAYSGSDIGYYILDKIVGTIFVNEQWILIITSLIIIVPIATMYYKESKNCLVSIALFMVLPTFQMNFSGIRQAIAIAFVAPAMEFVKEKKLLKFVIVVFFASLFHNSAVIMLAMYPLYHATLKLKHLWIAIPIGLIIFRFNEQIYLFILGFMGDKYEERYAEITETGAYTMIIVFIMFAIYAFVMVDEKKLSAYEKGYRNFLILVVFLQMFVPINSIAMRMNYYFIILVPIIITQVTTKLRTKDGRIILVALFLIYMIFTIYYVDKSASVDSLDIYPYEFYTRK